MENLTLELRQHFGNAFEMYSSIPLSGGDINSAYKLNTSEGVFCVKINSRYTFPGMFEKEALGLKLLSEHSEFTVPNAITTGTFQDKTFLLLTFIESASRNSNFWGAFGEQLAAMHRQSHESFGLDYGNYIGSLHQENTPMKTWSEFYAQQRLLPQAKLAFDRGTVDNPFVKSMEALCAKLQEIFPTEPPALLHGDLWSGNYMVDDKGAPALIDPAVYYGHREMDLAMMQLFGGFDRSVFDIYDATYPLETGWNHRVDLCQLYPILVHVNLFGGSYIAQAKRIMQRYV